MEEKIEQIHRLMIMGSNLTNSALKGSGLSEEDINFLVSTRVIEPAKDDMYRLIAIDDFRRYGVKLLQEKRAREANICFKKCYELAPTGKDICLQILLAAIKAHDYDKAFEIFANLDKINPDKNSKNNNFYLYLLAIINEIPEQYHERVRNIGYDDLMLPKSTCNKPENEVRSAVLNAKYTYAYHKINEMITKANNYSVKFELIKGLLAQAIGCEKAFKKNLITQAQNKQYYDIVEALRERKRKRYLTNHEMYVLLISEELVRTQEMRTLPISTINYTLDLYEAISRKNYKIALEINTEFLEGIHANKEEDIINILLIDLNNLIQELKEEYDLEQSISDNIVIEDELIIEENSINDEKLAKEIKIAEELAYYIKSINMPIMVARKKYSLHLDSVSLIKLVYARDCYIEANSSKDPELKSLKYSEGDKILYEVENSKITSSTVLDFIEIVKKYKATNNLVTNLSKKTLTLH